VGINIKAQLMASGGGVRGWRQVSGWHQGVASGGGVKCRGGIKGWHQGVASRGGIKGWHQGVSSAHGIRGWQQLAMWVSICRVALTSGLESRPPRYNNLLTLAL